MLLADKLKARKYDTRFAPVLNEYIEDAVVVLIDNVRDYVDSDYSKMRNELKDLPNVVPPWPNVIFEYKINSNYSFAVWQIAERDSDLNTWDCSQITFLGSANLGPVSVGLIHYTVGPDNRFTGWGEAFALSYLDDNLQEQATLLLQDGFTVTSIAQCFCHCKNVDTPVVARPPKLAHAQVKRHNIPAINYNVINILPIQHVLKDEAAYTGGTGTIKALSICRGHFKDYTTSGLFGKHKGVYFWNQQLKAGGTQRVYKVANSNTELVH